MKKLCILALLASANLYAEAEVKLSDSHIDASQAYRGSVVQNEKKNIVVITKQDIEKKQYKDMVDIFKDSPMTMVTNTPAGPLVALRGSGEKTIMRVKVLLDGKSITSIDEAMGVIPFNAIPVSNVEKIEIIPGGGITLYGSGSSSGVINIVTKAGVTKDYGSVNLGASSFSTFEASLNKGIRLGDKTFVNLAVEGKKGHGYRDEEKSKKLNVIGGINYEINDKNKIRIQGTQYLEDGDSTNEVNKKIAEHNRRKAGDLLSNVKSDRKAFSIDYEYKPTDNFTWTASGQTSTFTRDITQTGVQRVTSIPTGNFFDSGDDKQDLVILNMENDLSGKFEEKIKEAKLKGNYNYSRGNLEFGMEHIDHSLTREMDFKIKPFDVTNTYLVTYPKDLQRYTSDMLEEYPPVQFSLTDMSNATLLMVMNATGMVGQEAYAPGFGKKNAKEVLGTDTLNLPLGNIGIETPYMTDVSNAFANAFEKLSSEEDENGDYVMTDEEYENLDEVNSEVADIVAAKENISIPLTDEMTINDALDKAKKQLLTQEFNSADMAKVLTGSTVNSRVDVNKKTNSFYLFNSFDITDKLSMDTGLRYEGAKYTGDRYTDVKQTIVPSAAYIEALKKNDFAAEYKDILGKIENERYRKELTAVINEGIKKDHPFYHAVDTYLGLSEEKKAVTGTDAKVSGAIGGYDKLMAAYMDETYKKLASGKETSVNIPITYLKDHIEKKEHNVGGEIGFNYAFNDTDTGYVKYERGFNTPLPTQLTNKTYDPNRRTKLYWASNIETETMNNFEIGFRGMLNDNISYSVSGFLSDTYDEITSVVKDGYSHMNREWRFINLEKTRRMGIEFQSQQYFDKLHLKESFTYIDPKILANDYLADIRAEAEHKAEVMVASNTAAAMGGAVARFDRARYETQLAMEEAGKSEAEIAAAQAKITAIEKAFIPMAEDLILTKDKASQELVQFELENPGNFDKRSEFATAFEAEVKEKLNALEAKEGITLTNTDEIAQLVTNTKQWANGATRQELAVVEGIKAENTFRKGDRIPLSPKIKATFSADYMFTDKLKLGTNLTYVGSYINAEPGNGYEIIKTKVGGHVVTDLYGTYDITPETSVKFGVNNLFEDKYYLREDSKTVTPAPGRTYSIGITHRF